MRAILTTSLGKAGIVDVPNPSLKSDSILVRPHYVANNPCDFLITDMEFVFTPNQIVGCDYSGVVEKIGSDVKTALKVGDRCLGVLAGGTGFDVSRGAFADLVPAYGDFCFPVPKSITQPQAATLGIALSTIAVVFYLHLSIPLPNTDPSFGAGKPFFVYGGSTTTGLMAIQFAKLSGFRVITTCSPKNFELVKARGADEVYDYHDISKCTSDIKASVGEELEYAFVCVTSPDAPTLAANVLSQNGRGAKYVTIVGVLCPRDDLEVNVQASGQAVMADPYKSFAGATRRTPEERELGVRVFEMAIRYLEEGKILPPPLEERKGLEGALEGMEELRKGAVSGRKIVSRLV